MNIAIVGCGLIGQKRSQAMAGGRLVACADREISRAQRLAQHAEGCLATSDWKLVVTHPDATIVVIATAHDSLAEITAAAVQAGKHVLVEKPAARHVSELSAMIALAEEKNVLVHVGFNHRYHRAFRRAREIIDSGALGPLMFLRARYGHGGRIGYDQEWRANPKISGGGELIDQGVHVIDLARWFLGEFTEVSGFAHTYFW